MQSITVKDLMIPLAEYATVKEDATLYEAVMALEEAQNRFNQSRDKHRAVLVCDAGGKVVGKLSQIDILRGLEPRYKQIGDLTDTSRFGFTREFLQSMISNYGLFRKALDDLCRKAAEMNVRAIMATPAEGELIAEETTLDAAIHQLVMGRHQSLLVMRGEAVVGVLRLSDVFREICGRIKACKR